MSGFILFVDSGGYKSLPAIDALRLICDGEAFESVTSPQAAALIVQNRPAIDVLVTNDPDHSLMTSFRARHPKGHVVLVTELPMKGYSALLRNEEESLLDHVIVNKGREGWTVHQLRVTLHKLRSADIFGIEKYLAPHTAVHREAVRSSGEREALNTKILRFAEACHLGQHAARTAFGISEELLMNTVYDAPAAAGIPRFQNIDQTHGIVLEPEEYGELSFGCDGQILAIACSDPFGALRKTTLLSYLKKVLRRDEGAGLIDQKKGGAGLGFFKILYSSHGIICNVSPKKRTEIMALIDIGDPLRDFAVMPRSIQFFAAP